MSFFSNLCGCFVCNHKASPSSSSRREMQVSQGSTHTHSGVPTGRFILSADGDFVRRAVDHEIGTEHGPHAADSGYTNVVPLPQYTARPMSSHEKTLEAHMRDPPVSSSEYSTDEKSRNLYDEEVTSDGSSAISFPSSYGNTSTATRETPPPPYSPRHSAAFSRSRSVSVSSAMAVAINPPPLARVAGVHHGRLARSEADDQSLRRHRRTSWESR
ncbi:uncharacterized protein PFLUO_LOCUS4256 [Penicillium psychrofluorescens]|uniref:uncharacterized protein n=1 Tax=Penicillium psychrofluorescens TaxID=3158075 RepID=UPI003CCE2509